MTTRLILIDSDIGFMVTIKKALEETGEFQVSVAANGPAAEEILRATPHEVAVVDFDVPGSDAMELLRLLNKIQPGLPVIVTPNNQTQAERARYLDAKGVLSRPYTARDLILIARSVLSRQQRPQVVITPPPKPGQAADTGRPAVQLARIDLADQPERRGPARATQPLPEPADVLEEFEALERAQTGVLEEPPTASSPADSGGERASSQTRLVDDSPESEAWETFAPLLKSDATRLLRDDEGDEEEAKPPLRSGETRLLRDEDEGAPPATTGLLDWQEPAGTRQLADTDELDTLAKRHGWGIRKSRETRPLPLSTEDEPPPKSDDTPTMPDHDLEAMRQFLATDSSAQDPADFGAALDAVAKSQPEDYEPSPDDRAFRDLVDSMRGPEEERPRRPRLEELLASIATDTAREGGLPSAPGGALDFVLDAIRRGAPPGPGAQGDFSESDLDDTTIGQVIDGLFEPSFEGVLAALAGEEIGDEPFEEPTYGASFATEGLEPSESDRIAPDAMSDEDRPAWLSAYEAQDLTPPPTLPESVAGVRWLDEPPVAADDSSRYPATAALNAVAVEGADESFMLDDLLSQIEEQLPPAQLSRPRLKPLPSWGRDAPMIGGSDIKALFDRAEGIRPAAPDADEMTRALADASPPGFDDEAPESAPAPRPSAAPEPPLYSQDTRPSEALREEMDTLAFQDSDTVPYSPAAPAGGEPVPLDEDDLAALRGRAPDAAPAERDFAREETDSAAFGPFSEGLLSIDDLYALADLPAEAGTEEVQAERAQPVEGDLYPGELAAPAEALTDDERAAVEREDYADMEPDEEHLVPMPVETAARLLEGESLADAGAEDARIAQIAVQLTQYSLESSAQATMLSRPGAMLAVAGPLPESAETRLFEVVDAAWQTGPADSDSLIRFITLPDMGEFLLYSVLVENDLSLSMVFSADTPVRAIRRQASRLSESLALVPEPSEPDAALTLPSRPTDLRPPEGWREAVGEPAFAADEDLPARPGRDDGPYADYTCLWLPYDPGQELLGDFADGLYAWIRDIAAASEWGLTDLDIKPDYVLLSLRAPQMLLVDAVITRLMDETEERSAEFLPATGNGAPLWTDGYYFVSGSRMLSEREIARFITFQRQAQLG
jgi:DNA-binding response OmpR family regulator